MKIIPYVAEKHDSKFSDKTKLFGYVRGDIDERNNLWTSYIGFFENYSYGKNRDAVTEFIDWLTEQDCMSSVDSLLEFCKLYPETAPGEPDEKAFRFYSEDKHNRYLIKIMFAKNSKIFYVNAYFKTE